MASYYVYSGAAGAGTGANWANAYTTLATAISGKAAGDIFYVAHDHSESAGAGYTMTAPGSVTNPNFIYCVNRAGSVPPVSADLTTGATLTTTGASAINLAGTAYCYGLAFNIGTTGSPITTHNGWTFERCAMALKSSSNTNLRVTNVTWINTTLEVVSAGSNVAVTANRFVWKDTANALVGATIPTNIIGNVAGNGVIYLQGVDLSAAGSGKTIFGLGGGYDAYLIDCKLGAAVAISGTISSPFNQRVYATRSDSATTNYYNSVYLFPGILTTETAITRVGGASDGTTPFAWKVVTNANAKWVSPFNFECPPIVIWNEDTGSPKTITVEGIWGGGAVPDDDDIWIEVEYLGDASFPQGSFSTSGKADNLASGSPCPSSSESWLGTSVTEFKMEVTITPQMKGPISIIVHVGAPSSTFYIDPKVTL